MFADVRDEWKKTIENELGLLAAEKGVDVDTCVNPSVPPNAALGDIAFPLFAFAKVFKAAPAQLAAEIKTRLDSRAEGRPAGELIVAGPYLNVKTDMAALADNLRKEVSEAGEKFGSTDEFKGRRMMVEFSCPNTNKPLHLGHMRNDSLGSAMARILAFNGADVKRVNLINNRGVHICKSMLAYKLFGNGETPQSSGKKGDHLVGDYYVRFANWVKEEEAKPEAERIHPTPDEQAQLMLEKWEAGDPEVLELWNKMNGWTLEGLAKTYRDTGIEFDKYYFESDTYKLGRDIVLKGLEKGIFYRENDGSVWIDLASIGLDKKVVMRRDGTTLYITQDIGTAISRHNDWPFDSLIYVVGSEQKYHFEVLFYILKKLGFDWADNLYHLSYGMVNLPTGKMKSREGTVVDADDLLAELTSLAKQAIIEKEREGEVGDIDKTAHNVALGALNYFLLQVSPTKDMTFNPAESLSFSGNTGPYLQYMGARISSMLRKWDEAAHDGIGFDPELLKLDDERTLIKQVASFPDTVKKAGVEKDPSLIAAYLYELSKTFSKWYHDTQILKAETPQLSYARVELSRMVLTVLKSAFALLGIPFLSVM